MHQNKKAIKLQITEKAHSFFGQLIPGEPKVLLIDIKLSPQNSPTEILTIVFHRSKKDGLIVARNNLNVFGEKKNNNSYTVFITEKTTLNWLFYAMGFFDKLVGTSAYIDHNSARVVPAYNLKISRKKDEPTNIRFDLKEKSISMPMAVPAA